MIIRTPVAKFLTNLKAHEVRVSPSMMEESNLSSIQLADGSQEYIVQPITYHMLHCLYTIYKYAHPEFYGPDLESPETIMIHTDHCIDNLRKVYLPITPQSLYRYTR